MRYQRFELEASDGEKIVLDEVLGDADEPLAADCPLIVLLHGLSGSSESNYIRHFISHVQREKGARTYRIIVLHARGAARDSVLSQPCKIWLKFVSFEIELFFFLKTFELVLFDIDLMKSKFFFLQIAS